MPVAPYLAIQCFGSHYEFSFVLAFSAAFFLHRSVISFAMPLAAISVHVAFSVAFHGALQVSCFHSCYFLGYRCPFFGHFALCLSLSFHSSWPSWWHFSASLRFDSQRLWLLYAAIVRSMFFVCS
jgi:hypothetical protein